VRSWGAPAGRRPIEVRVRLADERAVERFTGDNVARRGVTVR